VREKITFIAIGLTRQASLIIEKIDVDISREVDRAKVYVLS
jgi:hypothetical protein